MAEKSCWRKSRLDLFLLQRDLLTMSWDKNPFTHSVWVLGSGAAPGQGALQMEGPSLGTARL